MKLEGRLKSNIMRKIVTYKDNKEDTAVSTNIENDYIIIFNDGGTKKIMKEQAENLNKASRTSAKFVKIDGTLINFSNIARVSSIQEYYEHHPEQRPVVYRDFSDRYDTGVANRRPWDSEVFWQKILRALKKRKNSSNYQRVTGGLDILILKTEEKLKKFHEVKCTENYEETGSSSASKSRADRIRAIKERRKQREQQISSIAEIL